MRTSFQATTTAGAFPRHAAVWTVGVVAVAILGCAPAQPGGGGRRISPNVQAAHFGRAHTDAASYAGRDPHTFPMFDGKTGKAMDWAGLMDRIAGADVIILGEQHDDPGAHAVQLAVVQDVVAPPVPAGGAGAMKGAAWAGRAWKTSAPTLGTPSGAAQIGALSMEMLERDEQHLVDDYLDGLIDADTFAKLTLSESWAGEGSWMKWYQPIIDTAAAAGWRVVAANAPRRYVRLARSEGYGVLTRLPADRRAMFALPLTNPQGYYKRFLEVMAEGHGTATQPTATKPATQPATRPALSVADSHEFEAPEDLAIDDNHQSTPPAAPKSKPAQSAASRPADQSTPPPVPKSKSSTSKPATTRSATTRPAGAPTPPAAPRSKPVTGAAAKPSGSQDTPPAAPKSKSTSIPTKPSGPQDTPPAAPKSKPTVSAAKASGPQDTPPAAPRSKPAPAAAEKSIGPQSTPPAAPKSQPKAATSKPQPARQPAKPQPPATTVPPSPTRATAPAGAAASPPTRTITPSTLEPGANIDPGFRSQLLWDATMADSIARARRGGAAKVIHLVGQFHADFAGGTVQELRARLPGVRVLILSMQRAEGASLRSEDRDRADVVVYTGAQKSIE